MKVLMDRPQKGHLQWVVHSVAYFFWLVKNLKYTRPHGSNPFLALAATSLSCNAVIHQEPMTPPTPCATADTWQSTQDHHILMCDST